MDNCRVSILVMFLALPTSGYCETVSAINVTNHKSDLVYLINWNANTYIEQDYEKTADQADCYRPDKTCNKTVNDISENQLLAAIIYSEASPVSNSFEENAAIGKALLRKKEALGYHSIQDLLSALPNSYKGDKSKTDRFLNIVCSDESDLKAAYPQVYDAVQNANDPAAMDFSNGGCYWSGPELAAQGPNHPLSKYYGYVFSDPSHNLWPNSIDSTPQGTPLVTILFQALIHLSLMIGCLSQLLLTVKLYFLS